ncbi:MAG: DUF1192 domain-containing protein [Marivibrio sp.]|uniref:DUF1192 domain-containing protein n=1 Tax=Marivibrio sp. TaxID=2039719 RepID=UPI0032EB2DC4
MAIFEDDQPKKPQGLIPRDLDQMSIEALEDYIGELQTEIDRAKAKIADKRDARGAAEGFFKS